MPHKENFPYEAIAIIGQVLEANSHKHPQSRWRKVSIDVHIAHAQIHIQDYWTDMISPVLPAIEDHLAHAFTRLAMAIAVRESNKKEPL